MCRMVLPSEHKRNTHQAFPILFHPVICMNPTTPPALRTNQISQQLLVEHCTSVAWNPVRKSFKLKSTITLMCRLMSNREIRPWITLTGGFHLHERSDGCVLCNEHGNSDVMAGNHHQSCAKGKKTYVSPTFCLCYMCENIQFDSPYTHINFMQLLLYFQRRNS